MEDERVISFERGKQLADQLGVEFFETSAKENVNVKVSNWQQFFFLSFYSLYGVIILTTSWMSCLIFFFKMEEKMIIFIVYFSQKSNTLTYWFVLSVKN